MKNSIVSGTAAIMFLAMNPVHALAQTTCAGKLTDLKTAQSQSASFSLENKSDGFHSSFGTTDIGPSLVLQAGIFGTSTDSIDLISFGRKDVPSFFTSAAWVNGKALVTASTDSYLVNLECHQ